MSFVISQIIVWSERNKSSPQVLDLSSNRLNYIYGEAKTGKTTVWHIINQCLGSKTNRIPRGRPLSLISWYGIRIVLPSGRIVLIARQHIAKENASPNFVWFEESQVLPSVDELRCSQLKKLYELREYVAELVCFSALENISIKGYGVLSYRDMFLFNYLPQHALLDPSQILPRDGSNEQKYKKLKDILGRILSGGSATLISAQAKHERKTLELKHIVRKGKTISGAALFLKEQAAEAYDQLVRCGLMPNELSFVKPDSTETLVEAIRSCLNEYLELASCIDSLEASVDPNERHESIAESSLIDSAPEVLKNLKATPDKLICAIYSLGRSREVVRCARLLEHIEECRREYRAVAGEIHRLNQQLHEYDDDTFRSEFDFQFKSYVQLLGLDRYDWLPTFSLDSMSIGFTDKNGNPMQLSSLGSAANYSAYHLASVLTIHRFIHDRLVDGIPDFLVVDQPAFLASATKEQAGEPNVMIDKLADLCRSGEISNQLILIGSHLDESTANRNDINFVGKWINGEGLVPDDWSE